jgi:FkbM family methyltransferase
MKLNDKSVAAARWYIRNSPTEFAKWRLARLLDRHFASSGQVARAKVRGFWMELDTTDLIQRTLYCSNDFEPRLRQEIEKRLGPGDTFIDIGCNVGFFSLCAARTVGPAGLVYAFEPAPATVARLRHNIELNSIPNIRVNEIALSDTAGSVRLFLDGHNNSGAASLRKLESGSSHVDVQSMTYDEWAERYCIPAPSLFKIDVEAAEVRVLRGMAKLLSSPNKPPIIIEVSEGSLRQFGTSKDELFGLLKSYGYGSPQLLSPVRRSLLWEDDIYFQYDALFTARTDA